MTTPQKKKKTVQESQELEVYLPESVRFGVYSNVANVNTTENEITIVFMHRDRMGTTAVSKVILPLSHAESLSKVLLEAVRKVEEQKKQK